MNIFKTYETARNRSESRICDSHCFLPVRCRMHHSRILLQSPVGERQSRRCQPDGLGGIFFGAGIVLHVIGKVDLPDLKIQSDQS